MQGLLFVCFQKFLTLSYGADVWIRVVKSARLDFHDFEPMLSYDADLSAVLIEAASQVLDRPADGMLEDLGTFLVTHPALEVVRRLLRFGGADYISFLQSLDDLPDRVRLAVPDLYLPDLRLKHRKAGFALQVCSDESYWTPVILGLLRAMADDYGVLALVERAEGGAGQDHLVITIAEHGFSEGRSFDLAAHPPERRGLTG